MIHARRSLTLILLLAFLVSGWSACATTGIGKAVQTADAQKQVVERAAIEFVKAKLKGDPRITPAVYAQARDVYEHWQGAQGGLATALSSWKAVSNPENESRLQAALSEVMKTADVYLALVGKYVDLTKIKLALEGK